MADENITLDLDVNADAVTMLLYLVEQANPYALDEEALSAVMDNEAAWEITISGTRCEVLPPREAIDLVLGAL